MKKLSLLILAVILIGSLILGSCGDSAETTTLTTPPTDLQDTPPPVTTPTTTPATTTPAATTAAADPLRFPADDYIVETKTVETSEGDKEITYHLYEYLVYVTNPVDADYQSMNVSVPVSIDGVDIDATNAPIYFEVNTFGYKASTILEPALNANSELALAAGYVVVAPGCRGNDNQAADGTYYGKAPAGIVDLKCAVKYIRYNDDLMPGNADWIIASGSSGGGAISALLGASGNSDLYDAYFEELGAADGDDDVFASAPYCPITDVEHADMAYEWMFGTTPLRSGLVDQELSLQLADAFTGYLASLNLEGKNGFGTITTDNYGDYLVQAYLIPSADNYLLALSDTARDSYLERNEWITWANDTASFTWADFVADGGRRLKELPAFDAFDLSTSENSEFGNETTNAGHFTNFSLRYTSGDDSAEIDSDLATLINLMNPMYFIGQNNSGCADYWWIRVGTRDKDTSLTVSVSLATSLENLGKDVNMLMYWEAGHGANQDKEDFIDWVGSITGYNTN